MSSQETPFMQTRERAKDTKWEHVYIFMNMKEDILPVMAGNRGSTVRGQVNDV
jgi:hypothetical protein